MAVFITPVDITPTADDTWQDVDVSSYCPAGTSGVMLHIDCAHTVDRHVGWRKKGSTDNRNIDINNNENLWAWVGVDSNRVLQISLENSATIVYLVGYFGTDAVFFDDAVNKSLGSTGSWTDIDISSDTGDDTAIAAIFEVNNSGSNSSHTFGLRKNGSTDNRQYTTVYHTAAVIGVDGSEICEGIINSTFMDFYLVGYITSGATFLTNATDMSLGSTGSYTDLSALPAGSIGGIFQIVGNGSAYALRKNGSSEDIYRRASNQAFASVECDASRLIEGKIASTDMDFFLVGTFETGTSAINLNINNILHNNLSSALSLRLDSVLNTSNIVHDNMASIITLLLTGDITLNIFNPKHNQLSNVLNLNLNNNIITQNSIHDAYAKLVSLNIDKILNLFNVLHSNYALINNVSINSLLNIKNSIHDNLISILDLLMIGDVVLNVIDSKHNQFVNVLNIINDVVLNALKIKHNLATQIIQNLNLDANLNPNNTKHDNLIKLINIALGLNINTDKTTHNSFIGLNNLLLDSTIGINNTIHDLFANNNSVIKNSILNIKSTIHDNITYIITLLLTGEVVINILSTEHNNNTLNVDLLMDQYLTIKSSTHNNLLSLIDIITTGIIGLIVKNVVNYNYTNTNDISISKKLNVDSTIHNNLIRSIVLNFIHNLNLNSIIHNHYETIPNELISVFLNIDNTVNDLVSNKSNLNLDLLVDVKKILHDLLSNNITLPIAGSITLIVLDSVCALLTNKNILSIEEARVLYNFIANNVKYNFKAKDN